MKRAICMILTGILVLLLSSCGAQNHDTVSFFYLRHSAEFIYGAENGVIAPENREVAGWDSGLPYLFRLYLEGPLDTTLSSPLPKGTRLMNLKLENSILYLEFSWELAMLEGLELTLAYACIATTGFALCDAEQIQISATTMQGDTISITLSRDSLTLLDDIIPAANPTEAAK